MTRPSEVVAFWRDAGPAKWFARDDAFDATFRERFLEVHYAASRRELEHWLETTEGALALLVLLDQFPRNAFRGSGHAFATDGLARHYASRAIERGLDLEGESQLRMFFYLPFEHSEDLADQERSVELGAGADESYRKFAVEHRDVIARFGRFPYRNRMLGRQTTPEEQAYLDAGGGFGG